MGANLCPKKMKVRQNTVITMDMNITAIMSIIMVTNTMMEVIMMKVMEHLATVMEQVRKTIPVTQSRVQQVILARIPVNLTPAANNRRNPSLETNRARKKKLRQETFLHKIIFQPLM